MKKVFIGIVLILSLLLVVSCFNSKENKKELNIYTWTLFIPEEIIHGFEEETGIRVNLSYYDNNDTMMSKLLGGADDYDIVSPSTDFIPVMTKLDLLEKLDKTKLGETFKNLNEELNLLEISKTYDEGLNYSIPYSFMATGITVNTDIVKEEFPKTVDIFLMDKYKGKMAMLDDGREVLGLALQYLGYKSDSNNIEELNEAKDRILSWKKNLAKFDSNASAKGIASGEFVIVHGYPDVFYEVEPEEEYKFKYFIPDGAMMYIDSMVITKKSKNKENAYKFLEYLYRPENFIYVLNVLRNPSIIKGVEEKSEVKPIISAKEILEKSTLPNALDDKTKVIQDKIWTEIKLSK